MKHRIIGLLALPCLLLTVSCGAGLRLHSNGVGALRIGDPGARVAVAAEKWGMTRTDTLLSGNGFEWRAHLLRGPQGTLLVEEDFGGGQLINRIRVEDPRFAFKSHVRKGASWGELRAWRSDWSALYLPDYGLWDLWPDRYPFIHVLIPGDTTRAPDAFPDSLRVQAIVVM